MTPLRPFQNIKDNVAGVMDFLVMLAGDNVAEDVKEKAFELLSSLAKTKPDITLSELIDIFEQNPALIEFAAELKAYTLHLHGMFFSTTNSMNAAKTLERAHLLSKVQSQEESKVQPFYRQYETRR